MSDFNKRFPAQQSYTSNTSNKSMLKTKLKLSIMLQSTIVRARRRSRIKHWRK